MEGLSAQLQSYEGPIRLGAFVIIFAGIALWEYFSPRRQLAATRLERWPGNVGLNIVSNLFLRIAVPLLAVDAALYVEENGTGLLQWLALPYWVQFVLAIVLLDCVIYWQHVFFHQVPLLWRLHRVHHTDTGFDATTSLRFHPIEILLSMFIKIFFVVLIGAPVAAVILFEVILNGAALFNHGNIQLPDRVDGLLRKLIVTPDMHRVHHSIRPREYNSNFGFNLSIWDRLFKTYHAQPGEGHDRMTIGQREYQTPETRGLLFMLLLPFRK
ncbi:MAG: sterol desaturase family protein [Alphaproteobacteria bacterium]|nr:MAG: sterol desaturase family protein [Alphaproteobacteria bacterium]